MKKNPKTKLYVIISTAYIKLIGSARMTEAQCRKLNEHEMATSGTPYRHALFISVSKMHGIQMTPGHIVTEMVVRADLDLIGFNSDERQDFKAFRHTEQIELPFHRRAEVEERLCEWLEYAAPEVYANLLGNAPAEKPEPVVV